MTLTYLCARASYLHLDLTRLPGAHRFWSTLRRGVGPVIAARMGPDRVELVVPETPDVATRRRVDLALRRASLEGGVPLATWSTPLSCRALQRGREAERAVVDLALRDLEEGRACDGLEPLFSTFRACVGACARPWLDAAALAHAIGVPRLELPVWAVHADGRGLGRVDAGRGAIRLPALAPLSPEGRVDSVALARAVSAAFRCPPPLVSRDADAWATAAWVGARLGVDLQRLAPRLGGVGASLLKISRAQAAGEATPPRAGVSAVRICLGDARLVRAVPAHRVVGPRGSAFAVARLAAPSARW